MTTAWTRIARRRDPCGHLIEDQAAGPPDGHLLKLERHRLLLIYFSPV